jgi:hypothetical protein
MGKLIRHNSGAYRTGAGAAGLAAEGSSALAAALPAVGAALAYLPSISSSIRPLRHSNWMSSIWDFS